MSARVMDLRQHIKDEISDLVANFLYYDRKEDPILPRGEIENAIKANEITVDEMIAEFADALRKGLK